MAEVVALVDDLFFQMKLAETAKQLGVEFRACTTPDALATEIAKSAPRLVIVDLNLRGNSIEAVERTASVSPQIPMLGFLSHVQVDLAERARAAGCHDVMPRSKLTRDLATILAQAKSHSA